MIIENSLEKWGYARLLIADYHLEYCLTNRNSKAVVDVVWNPFEFTSILHHLHGSDGTMDDREANQNLWEEAIAEWFSPLTQLYNGYYDSTMNLWEVRGSLSDLLQVWANLRDDLTGGPMGGDDEVFDYWPGGFDMLEVLSKDLIDLGQDREWIVRGVDRVVTTAIAMMGPPEKWEADGITKVHDVLTTYNLATKED